MKKIINFCIIAIVAMLGFTSCNDCDHEFIEVDYSKALVGTWTLMNEGFAEAWVVKADGSVEVTGVLDGEYYETKGTVKVKNNKMSYKFDNGDQFEGILEIIPGKCFSLAYESDYQSEERVTYNYCANDLADEIVGMWVYQNGTSEIDNDMYVQTYNEDGTTNKSGWSVAAGDFIVNNTTTYKVVGDLVFYKRPSDILTEGMDTYVAASLVYVPNGNSLGDILISTGFAPADKGNVKVTAPHLRIKQHLDLAGQKYDYIKTFVSNVKGEDKDMDFMGYTFNFAKMDGSGLDKMLKSLLFAVEFPDANTLGYSYQMNGNKETYNSPIVVEGNKMTIKMSAKVPTLKDVVLYTFQDADCSQMHFYMHKTAFVSFYTNMQAMLMAATDAQFDITNAEAVNAIYNNINNAVETINLSLVMSK